MNDETFPDEAFERRVSRYLDDALGEEDRLRFEEELAGSEEARRFVRDCTRIDRLAVEALGVVLNEEGGEERAAALRTARSRFLRRVMPVAALFLVAVTVWGVSWGISRWGDGGAEDPEIRRPIEPAVTLLPETDPFLDRTVRIPVFTGTRRGQRQTELSVFTIFDAAKEELHLFELERTRARIQPVRLDL